MTLFLSAYFYQRCERYHKMTWRKMTMPLITSFKHLKALEMALMGLWYFINGKIPCIMGRQYCNSEVSRWSVSCQ